MGMELNTRCSERRSGRQGRFLVGYLATPMPCHSHSPCRSLLLVSRLSCLVSSSSFSFELCELIGGASDLVPAEDPLTST